MLNRLRPRVTYANVVSSLCLFVLLGGAAYAASTLPKNSVGTKQLKKNAVTSAKVKNGTLKRADVKAGQFATPAQLASVNAAKLGGILPGGFVHGSGRLIWAHYKGKSRPLSAFFTYPGGLTVQLGCSSSGWTTTTDNSNIGSQSFDVFAEVLASGGSPDVFYQTITHDTIINPETSKGTQVVDEDVFSPAGQASVRVWLNFDNTTKTCDVRARGLANP